MVFYKCGKEETYTLRNGNILIIDELEIANLFNNHFIQNYRPVNGTALAEEPDLKLESNNEYENLTLNNTIQ